MNLGQLAPDLERFVAEYKRFGYATRTQLITEALRLLRESKAREQRHLQREELLAEYAAAPHEHIWKDDDGEDFA